MRAARARPPRPKDLLSEAEVQRLLLAASERAPTGVRNRALIALLYCTGLRLGEALALTPGELELAAPGTAANAAGSEGSWVRVGGPRARAAHLFPAARPYLESWQAVRAELALAPSAPLFCTLQGEPLEPAYVRAMLARLGRRAGLKKRVHAHGLRHSAAARMGRAGLAPAALASQLGHRRERSTRRALAGFGVRLVARGHAHPSRLSWSLAPEPGLVRARLSLAHRRRGDSPRPDVPRAGPHGILVRRWRPEEL